MPAMGVRPPFLTLVAVLAIAPVAGIPPNIEEKQLATPWATNSALERCLPPIIPSLTTAESNDSIPPSKAMANAGWINFWKVAKSILGNDGMDILQGMSPKADSVVATGILKK